MNYEALIEELKKWDEDEKFYREVWQRRKKGEPLDPLIKEKISIRKCGNGRWTRIRWIRTRQRRHFLLTEEM